MKRSGPLRRTTWLRRGKPLAARGRKATREAPSLADARAVLLRRSAGACEAPAVAGLNVGQLRVVCGVTKAPHPGTEAHHVWPEDRDSGRHDPARMLQLCARAHRWAHEHPDGAARLGLLRPPGRDTAVPSAS